MAHNVSRHVSSATPAVMQKIQQWIKDKYTPQRNQKPGEAAKPGLCPLPKPPVSKNKLPKQAKPKKPAKKGGGCGRSAMVPAGNCFPGNALAQLPDGFKRLDAVAAGDRLTTYNHTERDHFEETAETRIDPDTWRLVTVRQDQGEAGTIEADLLRPIDFFGGHWPNPGDEFDLDLPRLGLSGPVQVTAIAACPTIPPGPGRIVLSVFRHSRGSTGALHLSGHPEPIRVTPLHPVWSPSHNAWIPAGKLTPAHDVSLWKSTCRVDRYELDAREETVYNVEVDGDHCYRVGEQRVLVHNDSDDPECGDDPAGAAGSSGLKARQRADGSWIVEDASGNRIGPTYASKAEADSAIAGTNKPTVGITKGVHAKLRSREGRPVPKVVNDIQRAGKNDVYIQEEDGRFVVRGKGGREHIIEQSGEVVTSVGPPEARTESAHRNRLTEHTIRLATEAEINKLKKLAE